MFFVVSKVLGLVFEPVNFLVVVGLFGLSLGVTSFRRAGFRIAVVAALLFACICFGPIGGLLLRPLEGRFPAPAADLPPPTGIIVLGGALDEDLTVARGQPSLSEAAERLTSGVELARTYPDARLVFTGGSSHLRTKGADEAGGVRQLWLGLGVPAARMTLEDKSRNTFENATMTKALVGPKPGETWLLVTSAAHMPRSVGIFRKVGWPVVAYPVDYRTFGDDRDDWPSAGALQNLSKVEVAVHEWVGLIAYRLSGKTNTLFPAP